MDFNKETIEQLSKLSDDELTTELARQIKIKKENGTLGEIEKMVRMIAPMLTPEQKKRLATILHNIQNQ